MRLLNTLDLTLKEFYTDDIPEYAILSHTWGKDEVTFQDIQNLDAAKRKHGWSEQYQCYPAQEYGLKGIGAMFTLDADETTDQDIQNLDISELGLKEGWKKVIGACAHTKKYQFEWIWIDSCCIDKSSSADLSENLNLMYRFYADARVCYVFLPDALSEEDPRDVRSGFRRSKWFTRGWTLQELIAPSYTVFLDDSWKEIGTRYGLRDAISAITSIPVELFENKDQDVANYSIAQRMSWAAFRETTRPEDRAYSLMGLFDICMTPIYGEGGAKAFTRLQQEIIKISDDRSIFAWATDYERDEDGREVEKEPRGLFARSPDEFKGSGGVGFSDTKLTGDKSSFTFNNNGLRIHFPTLTTDDVNIVRASLDCQVDGRVCSIYLRKQNKHYVRCHPHKLILHPPVKRTKKVHVQEVTVREPVPPRRVRKTDNQDLRWMDVRLPLSANQRFERVTFTQNDMSDVTEFKELSLDPFTVSFRCHHSNENVEILFEDGGMLSMQSSLGTTAEGGSRADRLKMKLESGGFVTAALQISSWSQVEILILDYTTVDDSTLTSIIPQFIQVPRKSDHYYFKDVFPPDYLDRGLNKKDTSTGEEIYLSMLGEGSDASRLLIYSGPNFLEELLVAVGINESGEPWVHPFELYENLNEKTLKEIQNSYRGNGSRAQFKGNISFSDGDWTATIHRNDGVQFASHSLHILWKEGGGRVPFYDSFHLHL